MKKKVKILIDKAAAYIKKTTVERKTAVIAAAVSLLIIGYFIMPYQSGYLLPSETSIRVYDRNYQLLMELTPDVVGFSKPIELEEVPEEFSELLLFSEDKTFYSHIGFSFRAIGRAVVENISSGEVVSGGSTISQQVVKLKKNITRNNIFTKSLEIIRAIRLDLHFSKDEILESYLNHIFLGNRVYGVGKAAEAYFDKDVDELTYLEMAALVVIIPAPSALNLYDNLYTVEEKAKALLDSAYYEGLLTEDEWNINTDDHLYPDTYDLELFAPHFCFWAIDEAEKLIPKNKTVSEIYTTLDLELYQECLAIAKDRIELLKQKNANQSALLMVDNRNMEILSMVGSVDYFDEDGQINGVTALIQPGSSMKPFNYALAIESGRFTPATILPDIYSEFPSAVGKYIPSNYDERYHGPVRLANALGSSYNVSSVYLLNKVGLYNFYDFLKGIGFDSLTHSSRFYGLGLTLGNSDLTLYEEVNGYTVFPNGGDYKPLKGIFFVKTTDGSTYFPEEAEPVSALSPETAFLISHILSEYKYKTAGFGSNSPINFPFPIAVKTGTSKNFRDNTVLAYTEDYTIGIWAGNFSGEAMVELPSSAGAALILRDLVLYLYNEGYPLSDGFDYMGLNITLANICPMSGMLAGDECDSDVEYFIAGTEPTEVCDWHQDGMLILPEDYREWAELNLVEGQFEINEVSDIRITHPMNKDIYKIDPDVAAEHQQIELRAVSALSDDVDWYINNEYYASGKKVMWELIEGDILISARPAGNPELEDSISIVVVK